MLLTHIMNIYNNDSLMGIDIDWQVDINIVIAISVKLDK